MAEPYLNLDEKLTRSIAAYLRSVGLGNTENIVSQVTNQARTVSAEGLTTVTCGDPQPADGQPGNFWFDVMVELKFPSVQDPNDSNPRTQEVAARQRQAAINDQLNLSDDEHTLHYTAIQIHTAGRALAVSDGTAEGDTFAAENADMVDFTVIWWEATGFSTPQQQAQYFVSDARFRALCCAKNID